LGIIFYLFVLVVSLKVVKSNIIFFYSIESINLRYTNLASQFCSRYLIIVGLEIFIFSLVPYYNDQQQFSNDKSSICWKAIYFILYTFFWSFFIYMSSSVSSAVCWSLLSREVKMKWNFNRSCFTK